MWKFTRILHSTLHRILRCKSVAQTKRQMQHQPFLGFQIKVLVVIWMLSWQEVGVSQNKQYYLSFLVHGAKVLALTQRVNSLGSQSILHDESAHPIQRRVPSRWLCLRVFQFQQADIAGLQGLSHRRAKIWSDTMVCEGNYCGKTIIVKVNKVEQGSLLSPKMWNMWVTSAMPTHTWSCPPALSLTSHKGGSVPPLMRLTWCPPNPSSPSSASVRPTSMTIGPFSTWDQTLTLLPITWSGRRWTTTGWSSSALTTTCSPNATLASWGTPMISGSSTSHWKLTNSVGQREVFDLMERIESLGIKSRFPLPAHL